MSMRRSAALLIARSHRWCHVIHTAVRRGKYWTVWGDGGGKGDWQLPKLQAMFYLPFSSGLPAIALVHLPSYQFKWRRLSCARFDCLPRLHYRLRQDWAWACYWLAGCLSLCLSPPTPLPLPSTPRLFIVLWHFQTEPKVYANFASVSRRAPPILISVLCGCPLLLLGCRFSNVYPVDCSSTGILVVVRKTARQQTT